MVISHGYLLDYQMTITA